MAEQEPAALDGLVRRHATRYAAPPGLAARIGAALDAEAQGPPQREPEIAPRVVPFRSTARWRPLALAASFVLAIVLSSGTTWYVTAEHRQDRLAEEVVASHVRSMLAQDQHLTDVASSDQHTVKPWFGGKLDLSPPVVDLKDDGFPLIGGRLDYIEQRPVAALVYRHKQHVINLFVWTRSRAGVAPQAPTEIQGYNLRNWREGDMTFWAVSDVNGADLDQFVQTYKSAPPQ
jgi:anti-sigma factor RsiW